MNRQELKSYQKVAAIIFSRFDSKRLPGKALIDIYGRCLLGRVIDRAKCIKGIDFVIVATTDREIDDQIVRFARTQEVDVVRGSCEDVLQRALDACEKYKLTKFARICGDRPFFDPDLIKGSCLLHVYFLRFQ